ncbi:MAG: hypothetical protein D3910_15935 [Candidatus Electrothrix sp. ATG2]|nr:hypothetical protein [Candidatus Electrothrix sp. ATG2]
MNMWKSIILSLLLLFGLVSEACAHDPSGISYLIPFYDEASAFTIVPAYTGAIVSIVPGAIVGGGGYLIGYTVGLPFGKEKEFANNAFEYPAMGIVHLGGAVAGAPFFILEKVFYDFPRYLLESDQEVAP